MQKVKVVSKTELARIKDNTGIMVSAASSLKVTTIKQEDKAYDCLKEVKAQLKMIEGKRTAITSPLNQSLREANAMFKALAAPLKDASKIINDKILEFKLAQEAIAEAKQAKKEKIQASHVARGHEAHELVPEIVETGKSTMQKRWTYDLVAIEKVPVRFLELNLGAIRQAIDAGERKIAGLKIYQKAGLLIR